MSTSLTRSPRKSLKESPVFQLLPFKKDMLLNENDVGLSSTKGTGKTVGPCSTILVPLAEFSVTGSLESPVTGGDAVSLLDEFVIETADFGRSSDMMGDAIVVLVYGAAWTISVKEARTMATFNT